MSSLAMLDHLGVSQPASPAASFSATPLATMPPRRLRGRLSRVAANSAWIDKRMLACFGSLALSGWSDATAGPLLPYIQAYYEISYTVVSMIWIAQAAGFILASFLNVHLTHRLGEGKVFFLGAICQTCGYALIPAALPFGVMVASYAVNGFGMALQDAQANTYVAGLPSAAQKLGVLHALYGVGALLTPLAATAMIDNGIRWSYAYAILVGWSVLNAGGVYWGFRLERMPQAVQPSPPFARDHAEGIDMGAAPPQVPETANATFKRVLTSKITWLFCAFIALYVGAEVSTGGWVTTFLIDEREGGVRAGYVVSGFWAGLTLGRLVLPSLNVWIGEWRAIAGLVVLTLIFEAVIWVARSFVGAAVLYAITGFLLGPMYPSAISLSTKLLPKSLHTGAIGFLAALGQSGSAVFPFIVGALAQKHGAIVLQPVLIVLLAVMLAIWFVVPRPARKD